LGEKCPLVQAEKDRVADSGSRNPAKTAIWDLRNRPTTFDFATWLVVVKTIGCDHVRFIDGEIAAHKYPAEVAWKRFRNILKPLCGLMGLTHDMADGGRGIAPAYHYGTVAKVYEQLGEIALYPRLAPIIPGEYVTVTLRQSFRNAYRNASDDWTRVIDTLQARGKRIIVLNDCEERPIPIARRAALYGNAAMNLGASNGPLALCHFSDWPYLTFNMIPRENGDYWRGHMARTGFPEGSQFAFKTDRQKLIWEPDDYDRIMSEIDNVCE